jgi:subtilisin family serine protease
MKMDFQLATALAVVTMAISACGSPKTAQSTFSKADSDSCAANAIPQQFMVRYEDGSLAVIHAESEKAFIDGYLTENLQRIRYAEPDYRVHAAMLADSPPPATATADNWGVIKVAADQMWKQNFTGSGVIVAVVDTGMDITHPQLAPQVAYNPGEQGTDSQGRNKSSNGVDDDGNGFVDDVGGWNFVANKPLTGDNAYHGTHVSGIIGAYHSDTTAAGGTHVEGMAPGVKLLPLAFLSSDGSGSMSDGVRAIEYAAKRGAKVINASWGGAMCSKSLRDAISSLNDQGIIFVAAAGNDSVDVDLSPEYPAALNLASQFTVGATGDHDYMADYSNYGNPAVHIFAPGSDIVSTIPGGTMGALSGTSMATPFVTGAVALLLSAQPTATVAQIRAALYNTAVQRNDYINVSHGRLNLATTLSELRHQMGQ